MKMNSLVVGLLAFAGASCVVAETVPPETDAVVRDVRARADRRIAAIRATPNITLPAGAAAYYLSERAGDDAADGRTPTTAWRTVGRLNRTKIAPGSFVLFERGGLYRGSVVARAGVTYTAYGEGQKPRLYGSPENGADPAKWTRTDNPNVWAYDSGHRDVGTLVFDDGAQHARKIVYRTDGKTGARFNMFTGRPFNSYRDLDGDLHFWHDYYEQGTGKLYLYSAENPGSRFRSIEFNVKCSGFLVGGTPDVTIDNFTVKHVGVHGVAAGTCRNLTVSNCEFGWIGGSIQGERLFGRDHPTRLGNAVEVYGGCDGYVVTNCYIWQVYDAGVTHQLNIRKEQGATRFDQKNVRYVGNVFEKCNYSVEYFLTALKGNMSRMENILVEDNLMFDAGLGFCEQRPDLKQAAHIKAWYHGSRNRAKNFSIRNNVFCGAGDMLVQICAGLRNEDGSSSLPTLTDNVFIGRNGCNFGAISETSNDCRAYGPDTEAFVNAFGHGNRCLFMRDALSLAGPWRFALVPAGEDAARTACHDMIRLPGTTDEAKKGDGRIVGLVVERIHPQLVGAEMTRRLTVHPMRRYPFVGVAVYEREMTVPDDWKGARLTLSLERTKIVRAFVDGRPLGRRETLTTPAEFVLPAEIGPGRHTLRLEVDNRLNEVPVSGHQVSEDTQTNWNGVLGRIELVREDAVALARVDPYPNVREHAVAVRVVVRNGSDRACEGALRVSCCDASCETQVVAPVGESEHRLTLVLPADTPRWSEFTPALQTLRATFAGAEKSVVFGLRDFGTRGTQFTVNGRPTFLRGRHDACVWPKTGYAPMEVAPWRAYFKTLKDWGLNHVRCHSWCPPEAAFVAADEQGFYLQPEFPLFGGNFATDEKLRAYVLAESKRILDAYGHHPSFCLYTLSNEPHGGNDRRAEIVAALRRHDPRHLYAQASNGDFGRPVQNAGDDFWATFRSCRGEAGNVRGSYAHADLPLGAVQAGPSGTRTDYARAVAKATVPLLGHEVGQYQAFPDFSEIAKYDGVLKAVNLEIFQHDLARAGMADQAADFFRASGRLVALNYREEVEAALRTPGFGGFQLLDLQDFPGQGTALVGLLNVFMENKGFTTPAAWRQVCAPTVPLARFDGFTRAAGETFSAALQVAHYGQEDRLAGAVRWRFVRPDGRVAAEGRAPFAVSVGAVATADSSACVTVPALARAEKWTLKLGLEGRAESNAYSLWVYPASPCVKTDGVVETHDLAEAERLLAAGRRVLCTLTRETAPTNAVAGCFASDFWNWRMFDHICRSKNMRSAPGTLGLLIQNAHPALAGFPTAFHSDYQWRDLMLNACNVPLGDDREAQLIVQGIDTCVRNLRLGVIWEKARGNGRLVVSAIDLDAVAARPEARALKASLLTYLSEDGKH